MAAKYSDRKNEWLNIWYQDKKDIIATMYANLNADLKVGYNPLGNNIKQQRQNIDIYTKNVDDQMHIFYRMTEEEVDRWCFYDLKSRGVIE